MTQAELKILSLMPRLLSDFYAARIDLCRFIMVGGLATVVHFIAALSLHHGLEISPLWSNFMAFCTAFSVTYVGNYFWAFESSANHITSSLKSLIVSLTGLCVSQFIVWALTEIARAPFYLTLFVAIMIVPIITFSLNRYWVFKKT